MSDNLFYDIEEYLASQVTQTEEGRTIKTRHDGDEPPDDGNEWTRCDLMQGGHFWVLTRVKSWSLE